MRFLPLFLLGSALTLAACGGADPGDREAPPADPDDSDAGAPACTVSTEDFGDKGALTGQALFFPGDAADSAVDDALEFDAFLEASQPADGLIIQLFPDYGVFTGKAIEPGTYTLSGDDLNYATCGLCVMLATNVTASGGDGDYMATGGTVTITTVGTEVGGTLAGTLTDVQFQHVNINPTSFTSTKANDDCTTALTNATFSGTLEAPPPAN